MNKTENFFDSFNGITLGILKLLNSPTIVASLAVSSVFLNYYARYDMFIQALLVCILADSLFGVWLAYKNKSFEWNKAMKIIEKIVVYSFYLLIVHFVSRINFIAQFDDYVSYLTSFIYTLMITNEGRSAIKNGNRVYPNKVAGSVVRVFDIIEGKANKIISDDGNNKKIAKF
jgi:hypothetical protein